MTRRTLTIFLAGAAAMVVVACSSDTPVAPASSVKNPDALQPELRRSGGHEKNLVGSFVISPRGGDYRLGDFTLHVPAGALCDPRSSYGRGSWNDPCVASRRSVSVNVELRVTDNRQWIDFTPNLRFTPSADPARWVTVATHRPVEELSAALERGQIGAYALLYARGIGEQPIDESVDDPSMITHVRLGDGLVWRRIKHFSGYTITAGAKCDPATDPSCSAGQVDASGAQVMSTAP